MTIAFSIQADTRPRVLVVEDDEGIAQGLRALLASRGFRVDVEHESRGALSRVSLNRYQVVVADFDLGEDDGLDLVRRLRDLYPSLPVLAVTATDRTKALESCQDLGLEGCFEKPVDPDQLLDAVTRTARS